MKYLPQKINGVFLIIPEPFSDHRGVFRRHFCEQELKENKITFKVRQSNVSENFKKGTLRGFHFQKNPYSEDKLLSCLKGEVYDIVVDLRLRSKTYKKWISFKLSEKNRYSLLIPKGCANAFLTLKDNTVVHYYCSQKYNPVFENGIRYNDPDFAFVWPKKIRVISKKDNNLKNFFSKS